MRPSLFLRRAFAWLALPALVLGLMVLAPQPSWAASGGRIGGGSFRAAPSMPRSFSGGGGGMRGGGGFGGGGGMRGGYRGGGIGFPFLIPIFGFGGGGLFGFLVLMAVVGLIANAVRGIGGGLPQGGGSRAVMAPRSDGPVSIAQVQVGLLASARPLQDDLRRLAGSADTSHSAGLQTVLQETTLSLLRHPDLWVYANVEVGQVPFASAEATFNRLSMAERSKLDRELTTNVAGRRSQEAAAAAAGDSDATSDFIAVTVLLASRRPLPLKGADNADQLRQSLQVLGAASAADLIALEVIWQPDGAGEAFSTEQLLTTYPDLRHV